jgi:hypothetical protein
VRRWRRAGTPLGAILHMLKFLSCANFGILTVALSIKFSRYVNSHTAVDRCLPDNSAWRVLAMTESAKQRITGDVVILAIGSAILIVLAFVGAL